MHGLENRNAGEILAVLLGTYNGDRFLEEQLRSIAGQAHRRIDIWASDDGSTDRTIAILRASSGSWDKGLFRILEGPKNGFAENFRSLITNTAIDADYFAFCDQDDFWDNDKLSEAVAWLATQEASRPALYCSRTRLISGEGQTIGYSPLFSRRPSFRNAIVQSIAGGNTIVLNRIARDMIAKASRRSSFISHDWWSYMIVMGAGGAVHYAPRPRIGYRQHDNNLIGSNSSLSARLSRYRFLHEGGYAKWMNINVAGLTACSDLLTEDALDVLERFQKAREQALAKRLYHLFRSGAYRQSLRGTIGLYVACVLNKL